MKINKIVTVIALAAVVASGLSVGFPALSHKATAAACDPPSIMFGRWRWCGYFYNKYDDEGPQVRNAGVPAGVNTAQDFINLVEGDYASGDTQKITEAVFVVREMIGYGTPTPPCALGLCKGLTSAMIKEFEDRVKSYANTSENGSVSVGSNGSIQWFHSDYMHCGDFNTYYQNAWHDIAPFIINKSNTPDCNDSSVRFDHIIFYDKSGNPLWKIRRPCMNPIGEIKPLAAAPPQWALTSSITATSGGTPLTSGSYVQSGDPITFTYRVNNSKTDTATGISCQAHVNSANGWIPVPAPPQTTGPTPPGVTCKSSFPPGNSTLGTETIASAPNDRSVCRSLIVSPSTPAGGTSAVEVCVYVSSRPYYRVYGGDVSAGNPQPSACSTTTQAGIVGWSKDLVSHSGAGTKYGALAINKIYDFATNLGNAAGPATVPSGLAFSNTGASGDTYGGSFGTLPCMTDYYAAATGPSWGGGNVSALGTGTFKATGPISISGNINPNQRTVLYVNGDVTINGNITYPGSWNINSLPMFQLIVSGNIYIDKGVTQLDGMYVAQTGAPNTGIIYTCTDLSTPYTVNTSGTFNTPCQNKLTVNGAFIAKQVQLLRTKGTVKQSTAGEASNSVNQAETFNYTPAVWMASPPNAATQAKYDSITSLPPIL